VTLTTYRRLATAEWTKLRSLRSTTWTLTAMVVSSLALCALSAAINAHDFSTFSAADRATWDPTNNSLSGTIAGQLAIAVFGVLAITAEYSSGTIRASLTAVPHRGRFLLAKASVYAAVVLVIGEVVSFASFLIGQAIYSGKAPTASLAHLDVVRAVALAGVYLVCICLISMAIGMMLRHTAGAITTVVALLLVIPGILSALPGSVGHSVGRFLPEQLAGSSMAAVLPEPHSFGPWTGTAVLCSYVAVVLVGAATLLRRRDV
jgi:ABC-type transport system involved in multi-copper enzyme maturation permease subunit